MQTQMDGDTGRELDAQGGMPGGSSGEAEASGLTVATMKDGENAPNDLGFQGESGFKGGSG